MSQPLAETAIEVTADTAPFEEGVDKLAKKERRRKIVKPVEADTTKMLRQIDQALSSLRGNIEVDPNTKRLIGELNAALDGFTGDVNLDPNVTRLATEVEAALAGLEFEVPVAPVFPQKARRDAKGRFIKAGAELGDDAAKAFDKEFSEKISKALKKTGDGIAKIGVPIVATLLAATGGAIAFAGALAQISALAAALGPVIAAGLAFLPGFLLARAAAMGVFKLAVVGVGDALSAAAEGDAKAFEESLKKLSPVAREFAIAARDVIDSLRPIQQAIQDATFAGLADDVTAVGEAMQATREQAVGLAEQFNAIAAEALGFAGSSTAVDAVNSALGLVAAILAKIRPTITPLLEAFAGLAEQAGQFGDAIGGRVAGALTRLTEIIGGVDLAATFEAALPTLRTLGQIFGDVGAIAREVFAASETSGAGLLQTFAELTTVVATFLQSAGGFELLSSLMQTAGQIATALGGAIGALLPPLAAAITPIAAAIGPLADALGLVLAAVGPLLAPIGQLVAILGGALTQAIIPLVPVIASLAELLGGTLGALAPVLAQLGSTIAAGLGPAAALLTELFTQLAPVIADVVAQIGPALAPLLVQIGPLFAQLAEAVMPLIPALVALIPPLVQILVAFTPLIALSAQLIAALVALVTPLIRVSAEMAKFTIIQVIVPYITMFAAALTKIVSPLNGIAAKFGTFAETLNSIDWGAIAAAIGNAFTTAWNTVVAAVNGIVTFVTGLPAKLMSALAAVPGLVAGLFRRMGELALQAVGIGIGLIIANVVVVPQKILAALSATPGLVRGLFTRTLNAAKAVAQEGFNAVVAFVNNVPGRVGSALNRLSGVVSGAWSRAVASGRATAARGLDSIVAYVRGIPDKIAALAGRFASAGSSLVRSLVNGLKNVPSLGAIGSAIAGVIRAQANNIIGAINRGISQVDAIIPGSLPRIPSFADGVVTDKPTLGVFGEAGREVIIPLEKPARARQLAEESGLDKILTGGGDGAPVYVSLRAYIGDQEITSMITFEVDRALDDTAAQVDAGVRSF